MKNLENAVKKTPGRAGTVRQGRGVDSEASAGSPQCSVGSRASHHNLRGALALQTS